MLHVENDAEAGAATTVGLRPPFEAAPASASPELSDRPRRRTFTAQRKLRILTEIDGAADTGRIGAILRREGLYFSTLCDWRRQRDAGAFNALAPARRGPKVAEPNPLAAELARSQKSNADLSRRLARAEAVIDIQKKLRRCWASPWRPATACLDRSGRGTHAGQRIDRRGLRRARGFTRQCATPACSADRARAYPCEGDAKAGAIRFIKSRNFWRKSPMTSGPGISPN
jgi:transposase-like protein